jgi:hypothetical protein
LGFFKIVGRHNTKDAKDTKDTKASLDTKV